MDASRQGPRPACPKGSFINLGHWHAPQNSVEAVNNVDALRQVIVDRRVLIGAYLAITIPVCILVIFSSGVGAGSSALAACAICLIASSTLVSCFLARREQQYSTKDLSIIAAIAISLTLVGLALMRWSGFGFTFYGIHISGVQWALVGSGIGVLTAGREMLK